MAFDHAKFKQGWRAICALGGIDPAEGVQSVYQLCNVRAGLNGLAAADRVFEPRCDHPDDGYALRIVTIPRPTETAKWVQAERDFGDALDTLTISILREVYQELRDEREPEPLSAMDSRLGRPPLWRKEARRGHLIDVRVLA